MLRRALRSKIHKAHITHADLQYEGSITIPPALLSASNIMPYEAVHICNVTNGNRLETYAIKGENETDISMNGAAAHLCQPGDVIIIACFAYYSSQDLITHSPALIFTDENNRIKSIRNEVAGPNLYEGQ